MPAQSSAPFLYAAVCGSTRKIIIVLGKENIMKKKVTVRRVLALLLICVLMLAACGKKKKDAEPEAEAAAAAEEAAAVEEEVPAEEPEPVDDGILENGLFSITIPEQFIGGYEAETSDNTITVFDKASKEANCGGYVFGVEAYENPDDYAMAPGIVKIGELTGGDGKLYDIVLSHPTDVQYDFNNEETQKFYKDFYEASEEIANALVSTDGGSYTAGAGMKGEELYQDVLAKYVTAFTEEWDADQYAEEEMSPMYYAMTIMGETDLLNKIGYVYQDINSDGIEELLIGEIAEGDWKGVVYDIYTMVNREPAHAASGFGRNRIYVTESDTVCIEYSNGAADSGCYFAYLENNKGNLYPEVAFKVEVAEDETLKYLAGYGINDDGEWQWEELTEEDWNQRLSNFGEYNRFDYIPLAEVAAELMPAEEEAAEAAEGEEAAEAAEGEAAAEAAEGEEAAEAAEGEEAEAGEVETIGLANPWTDSTEEEASKLVPVSFVLPEGAENAAWSVMENTDGEPLVQMTFDYMDMTFTAREQAGAAEDADIAGMFYEWDSTEDTELAGWELPAKVSVAAGDNETAELCTWFDAENKTAYSLGVTAADLDGFDIRAVAEALCKAE